MKKILTLILMLVCITTLTFLVGCGEGEDSGKGNGSQNGNGDADVSEEGEGQTQVIEDGEREITVEKPQEEGESGKVTLEGEDGEETTIEVQDDAPSEESLGAPIYPGAEYIEGSGVSGTTSSGDKQMQAIGAEFTTGDEIGEVVSWYSERLGEPDSAASEISHWMFRGQDGSVTTVIVELFEGSTKITIAKVSGDIDINL